MLFPPHPARCSLRREARCWVYAGEEASGGGEPCAEEKNPFLLDEAPAIGGSSVLEPIFELFAQFLGVDAVCKKFQREAAGREEVTHPSGNGAVGSDGGRQGGADGCGGWRSL